MDPSFKATVRKLWKSRPRTDESSDDADLSIAIYARAFGEEEARRMNEMADKLFGPKPKRAKPKAPARPGPRPWHEMVSRGGRSSLLEDSPFEKESIKQEEKVAGLIEQRRFAEVLETLEHGLMLSFSLSRKARLYLHQATAFAALGREERALDALASAERCLDGSAGLPTWLRLRLEQLHLLCQAERYAEAAGRLDEALELMELCGGDRERLQFRSLVGRIAFGLEHAKEAWQILPGVRAELLAAGEPFDATAAGLDLGSLLAARGDQPALEELTGQLEPLAEEESYSPAARRTVKLFCRLARRGTLTPETGRKLAVEFRRARRFPRPDPVETPTSGV